LPLWQAFCHHPGEFLLLEKTFAWSQEFPQLWELVQSSYLGVITGAAFAVGWYLYQTLAANSLTAEREETVDEDEVEFPPLLWEAHKIRFVVGLQHQPYSLALVRKPRYLFLEGSAIYQNLLVVGSIGSGKTAGVMYPLLKQVIFYAATLEAEKAGALILDVKGSFYQQVLSYAAESGREGDIVLLELDGKYTYNPLHKPEMEAVDLAERCRMVMDLFNTGTKKDAFWDTKAAQMMTECIRLLRCTLNYCSLGEIHRLVTDKEHLRKMLDLLKRLKGELGVMKQELLQGDRRTLLGWFQRYSPLARRIALELEVDLSALAAASESEENAELLQKVALFIYLYNIWNIIIEIKMVSGYNLLPQVSSDNRSFWSMEEGALDSETLQALLSYGDAYRVSDFDYQACLSYFNGEFSSSAETTIESIKACVTQMTAFFASSERISRTFCPTPERLNFHGFSQVINQGKMVVLAMNVAEYPKVASTIAAYLKLDFQGEVQRRTIPGGKLNSQRPVFFICDEYQEFVTSRDGNFYGVSRESRCCSIVATQSYTSLLKALGGDTPTFETLMQNLISKVVLHSVDKLTIETMQLLTGKVERRKRSKNLTESAASSSKSALIGHFISDKASLSETVSVTIEKEDLFPEKEFTQTLQPFKAIAFLAAPSGMQPPTMIHLLPYFQNPILQLGKEDQCKNA